MINVINASSYELSYFSVNFPYDIFAVIAENLGRLWML